MRLSDILPIYSYITNEMGFDYSNSNVIYELAYELPENLGS